MSSSQRFDASRAAAGAAFAGGGGMGAAMRALDWSRTPLGPVTDWPQSLKTVVRLVLDSRYAMWLAWGPELCFFCNDAYRPTLGAKQGFLGATAREVWAEIWPDIGPRIDHVLATGEATWDEGLLLFLQRSGFTEESYHSFSYSPVYGDGGAVEGMLCVVTEDTERLLGERRLTTLAALSGATLSARSAEQACELAARSLADDANDLPFALVYLLEADGRTARRAACTGLPGDAPAAPERIALDEAGAVWPFAQLMAGGDALTLDPLGERCGRLHAGPWPEPIERAMVLPLARPGASERPAGFLVAGTSPRLRFDAPYRSFIGLIATRVATAISDARAFEEERHRADALAELDRAKTAFFSNVSHELRTPLTLMLGPLDDLLGAPAGGIDEQQRELLALAQRNGRRLQKLVNALLDFSRIEADRMQAAFEPVDLAALTADLASVFRAAMDKAGLRFVIDCPELPEPVFVDREMWEKIVINLVGNALKFTFDGEVRVALAADGGAALLTVSDTGTGIAESELPKLFDRFYRVEGARGRSLEGSGIGLALVRELARLHGGTVEANSRLRRGSEFSVRIPLGKAHLPAEHIGGQRRQVSTALDADVYLDEAQQWLRPTGVAPLDELPEPAPATASGGAAPRPCVLVADDNADMRGYLRRLLGREHDVIAAADGLEALRLARQRHPDLVLSDVMMPGLDGFALLRALRADASTAATPLILLSARAGEEARIEGIDAGADDYLVKPFSARELIARVGGALSLARARQQTAARERELRAETEHVLESITEGFIAVDAGWRFTYLNAAAETICRLPREQLLGRSLWDAFAEIAGSPFEAPYRRAMAERVSLRVDAHYAPLGAWLEVSVYPVTGGGLAFYFRDVLQSKQIEQALRASEERHRFLVELHLATQALVEPEAIMATVMRLLGEHLGADRCTYAEVEADQHHLNVIGNYTRGDMLSVIGRWPVAAFGAEVSSLMRANQSWVVHDSDADPRVGADPAAYRAAQMRAVIAVPLHKGGRFVATLSVHQRAPRRWSASEVELVQAVAQHCWEAIERARTQRSLRDSEARFRRLADAMPHIVFAARPDGHVSWINRYTTEFTGVTEEMLGTRRYGLVHPDDRERMRVRWQRALDSGEPYDNELRLKRADGAYRWVLSRALPVRDGGGRITEWVGGSVDIDALRQAQQALQDADRRKDEFLATLAHELRNPLAPLRNAVHLLQMAGNSAETIERVQAMMQRQIGHLVRLVDDLLEVARITGGKIELRRAPVSLASVLASAVETSRPLIEAGGHTLVLDPAGEPMTLDADAVRLAQVFANLLNNAAKYTEAGGRLTVTARRDGDLAVVAVRDTGVGIAPAMLPRVFDLFTQAEQAGLRSQGGLGIGLSLVKSLVGMHGGEVEARSEGLGRGSEFVVRLPLAQLAPAGTGDAPAAGAALRSRRRVLVVDDNRDAAESLGMLLGMLGADVQVANDGPAALAAVQAHRPAVVLLDIGMPGMDGYEVARRIRSQPRGGEVTLIALTGWGQQQDRQRSHDEGFDHHLVKPADIDALQALLEADGPAARAGS